MAKVLLPNQCNILHPIYGPQDCCICQANARITELEAEIQRLKGELAAIEEEGYICVGKETVKKIMGEEEVDD